VAKTYLVEVPGPLGRDVLRRLRSGVDLDDGPAVADEVRVVGTAGSRTMVEITLHEGRNHIVRRMMDAVGHPVRRLVRTRVGPVQLGNLKAGRTRHLTRHEVGVLYRECGL
jgi:23S rRNA pseudouridine2605 synthase